MPARQKGLKRVSRPTIEGCPECGTSIPSVKKAIKGEILDCPDCAVELEVIEVDPFTLDYAPETEEDWGE